MNDPFENALHFLNDVKNNLSQDDQLLLERLQKPQNLVKGQIEVKMDDGSVKKFNAYRSQHNDALGPFKGGIRFHQQVSESEVKALSLWMSLKCSIAGIPYGGGKGGVEVDPSQLSQAELERLSRAYITFIADHIGVDKDVPAPDVNTDGQIMAWMLDEYEKIVGHHEPGALTGKPLEIGGSEGRTKATGYGGYLALNMLRDHLQEKFPDNAGAWYHKPRNEVTIAVQGFGNVGYYFALTAAAEGYRVVAVSDSKGAIYVKEGLDPEATLKCKEENGTVVECYCTNGVCRRDHSADTKITNDQLLELDVDILVPSALEGVIHAENADRIKAPVILELANGPITSEGDEILSKKDIMIIPDIFANSGGVTVSYLEWVQNRMGYYWKEHEVDEKLGEIMSKAFASIWKKYWDMTEAGGSTTVRKATYVLAVERILKAERLRR